MTATQSPFHFWFLDALRVDEVPAADPAATCRRCASPINWARYVGLVWISSEPLPAQTIWLCPACARAVAHVIRPLDG